MAVVVIDVALFVHHEADASYVVMAGILEVALAVMVTLPS